MQHKAVCILIGVLTGLVALTAIGGGIAMLTGIDKFPGAWLEGTIFPDYTIPALALAILVGGSSLLAAVMIFFNRAVGALAAMAAGLGIVIYILVEIATLKQSPPGPTWIELVYLSLGVLIFGLGAYLWLDSRMDLQF